MATLESRIESVFRENGVKEFKHRQQLIFLLFDGEIRFCRHTERKKTADNADIIQKVHFFGTIFSLSPYFLWSWASPF